MHVLWQVFRRPSVGYATILFALALGGCSKYQEPGLPAPPPVGIDVQAINQVQIEGALSDKLTIYLHEWSSGGDTLGEYGSRHLAEITDSARDTDHPILVERSKDSRLDDARREYLVRYLDENRIPDADHRVVIGRPVPLGEDASNSIQIWQARPTVGGGR